ncbi:hypothetical protein TrVGV298_004766 [Trichoderma virens]|nr:hypothetical protein TrVGV298_004766 [Trichoderma virens]
MAQAQKFHDFVLWNEFTLNFTVLPDQPLRFLQNGSDNVDTVGLCLAGNSTLPDYFRLVPIDSSDASKGYYLWSGSLYVSKYVDTVRGQDCVLGKPDIKDALIWYPTFLSGSTFTLGSPGYINPRHPGTPVPNPLLSCSTTTATTQVGNTGVPDQSTLQIPTTGRTIAKIRALHRDWHNLFQAIKFPLNLVDGTSLRFDVNPPTDPIQQTFLTPEGDGTLLFQFVALDPNDFRQGYYLTSSDSEDGSQDLDVVVYLPIGFREGLGPIHRIFKLPTWAMRMMRMMYFPESTPINLGIPGLNSFVQASGNMSLKCLPRASATGPSIISLQPQNSAMAFSGYIMTVQGNLYVKFVQGEQTTILTDQISQATPLCLVGHNDGTISFWNCMSNHVISTTTIGSDTVVVFKELDDLSVLEPRWSVGSPVTPSSVSRLDIGGPNDTFHVRPILDVLNHEYYSKKGRTWNVSYNNSLTPDWVITTPNHPFASYSDFEMPIADTVEHNGFFLKPFVSGEPIDPRHPAVDIASSVQSPGNSPLKLHAGHSRRIYEEMYNMITSGTKFVDIMSMLMQNDTPTGQFKAAVRNAITYLSNKPGAEHLKMRIMFGAPLTFVGNLDYPSEAPGPFRAADVLLSDLTRDITNANCQMTIYVGYSCWDSPFTWNHAKIIAVDGSSAMTGGHNMWYHAYLGQNPRFDATMKLSGLAAEDAHLFAETVWNASIQKPYSIPFNPTDPGSEASPSFVSGAAMLPNRRYVTQAAANPPSRLYSATIPVSPSDPARMSGSGVPVLSVARMLDDAPGAAPGDKALVALLDSATSTIYISGQGLKDHTFELVRNYWIDDFMSAIGRALKRGVQVKIFLSSIDAGSYAGDQPTVVIEKIGNGLSGMTPGAARVVLQRLSVQSFPSSSRWGLNPNIDGQRGIGNHAKLICVDSRAVSIGSQNFYPSWPAQLSEFTYIFESQTQAQQLMDSYFTPLAAWCDLSPTGVSVTPVTVFYTVTIATLVCKFTSESTVDQVYLAVNDIQIWPTNATYKEMVENQVEQLSVDLQTFTGNDEDVVVSIYDYDFITADDRLKEFRFNKDVLDGTRPGDITRMDGTDVGGEGVELSLTPKSFRVEPVHPASAFELQLDGEALVYIAATQQSVADNTQYGLRSHVTDFFNGRIDSLTLKTCGQQPLAFAKYDFSLEMSSDRILDISGRGQHGVLIKAPTRAVKGYDLDGSECD